MPASGSSSELSPHQMAIRSHPGVQKIPASGISSVLSAYQMAPAGAISRARKRGRSLREWGASLLGSRSCLPVSCAPLVFRSSTSRFEFCVLHPIARLCLQKLSTRVQLRGFSNSGLRSLTVQMYDVFCGLASYGSYISDLVICVV